MKGIVLACIALSLSIVSTAQTDSTSQEKRERTEKADTIKVGGMIIIRRGDRSDSSGNKTVIINGKNKKSNSKVSTNWFIVDVGFNNYNDNTDYTSAAAQNFAPGPK
jgi:hypothetical protein